MNYIVDFIFLVIFAAVVFGSKKKGFFSSLFDLAAYIVSLVGAKLLSTSLAKPIYVSSFEGSLRMRIEEMLGSVAKADYSAQITKTLKELPSAADGIMELLGVDKQAIIQQVSDANVSGQKFIDYLMNDIVSPIAIAIVRTVLFAIIVFVLSIVLRIILSFFKGAIKKLPKMKQIDSGLGIVLGVLKGVVLVFILALILSVAVGFIGDENIVEGVNNSLVVNTVKGFMDSISGYVS